MTLVGWADTQHLADESTLGDDASVALGSSPVTTDDPQPGQPAAGLDTPALVLDLDALDRNIARMAAFARRSTMRWRPHAKAHKSAWLAQLLTDAGAVGACVQKTAEAECLAQLGVADIYISNEVTAPPKLVRVAALALRLNAAGGRLAIAVDHAVGVQRLAEAMRRALSPGRAATRKPRSTCSLKSTSASTAAGSSRAPQRSCWHARSRNHPVLRFAGLQAYHGGAQHIRSVADRRAAVQRSAALVKHTIDLLQAAGIEVPLVTGCGTGSFALEAETGVWGEMQCGSFLFMDADYAANEAMDASERSNLGDDPAAPRFEHSLFVQSQVMSVAADHAVCDAGHKSHAIDSGLPKVHDLGAGHGLAYGNGGDEHGVLRPLAGGAMPAIDDLLWLIPGHCDPTVNLHDRMIGVRGGLQQGTVEQVISIDARGEIT